MSVQGKMIDLHKRMAAAESEIERLTAENERLRAALTEAARLLNLEQLQGMSEKSVYTLRDIGLLVHQQSTQETKP